MFGFVFLHASATLELRSRQGKRTTVANVSALLSSKLHVFRFLLIVTNGLTINDLISLDCEVILNLLAQDPKLKMKKCSKHRFCFSASLGIF